MGEALGKYHLVVLAFVALNLLTTPLVFAVTAYLPRQQTLSELTGVLDRGVEAGCVVLRADDGHMYTLLNLASENARFGSRVLVKGFVVTDVATTCMQGTAFRVVEITYLSVQTSTVTSEFVTTSSEGTGSEVTKATSMSSSNAASTSESGGREIPLPPEAVLAGVMVGLIFLVAKRRREALARGSGKET